jgi:hypothetical protein
MARKSEKVAKPSKPAAKTTQKPAKKTVSRPKPAALRKPAKPRKPKAKTEKKPAHAPDPKELAIIRRRDKILDLRETGASIRQISAHLIAQGEEEGCSPSRVHEILVEGLEDLMKNQRLKTQHFVQLELNKLDRNELALLPNLLRLAEKDKESITNLGRPSYADAIEKYSRSIERIWKRRDTLLGLNKQKIEVSGEDGAPIPIETAIRVILPEADDMQRAETDDQP